MTTQLPLPKDRLEETIGKMEHFATNLKWTNADGAQTLLFAADGLRALLAAYEQEPVAYTEMCEITNMQATGLYLRGFPDSSQGRDIPLYIHPAPLIPAAVPEKMTSDYAWGKLGISAEDCSAWADGWNARAAMLQAEYVKQPSSNAASVDADAGGEIKQPASNDDTCRLDWLDAQNKRLNDYHGTTYGWKFDANFQRNAMMLNDSNCCPVMTVREAIDAAMAAAPKGV